MRSFRLLAAPLVATALLGSTGCGSNLREVLYQAASASGQSLLDGLFTDFQNNVADAFDQANQPQTVEQPADGGDTTPVDETPIQDLTGDPIAGEDLFTANNCSACHCADAVGGCALNAPGLVGISSDELDGRLRGDLEHPGGKFTFSNQDIVDLEAFLASLSGG